MGCRPSEVIGLVGYTYEAYCFDEAVVYFGLTLENRLEEASAGKPGKEERKAKARREAVLEEVFNPGEKKTGFADPAVMFQ